MGRSIVSNTGMWVSFTIFHFAKSAVLLLHETLEQHRVSEYMTGSRLLQSVAPSIQLTL